MEWRKLANAASFSGGAVRSDLRAEAAQPRIASDYYVLLGDDDVFRAQFEKIRFVAADGAVLGRFSRMSAVLSNQVRATPS